jgi:hypothetical protein
MLNIFHIFQKQNNYVFYVLKYILKKENSMKSIFDPSTKEELVKRINGLSSNNTAKWGKMDVFQMLRHCTLCEEMMLGKIKIKRVLIGRLIGKMILKKVLKDEKPFGANSPTAPILKTTDTTGDMEVQRKEWLNQIEQYAKFNNTDFVHPFFGPMTKEQIGFFAYKHADHHLRQFGA